MTKLIDRQTIRHRLCYSNKKLDKAIAAGVIPPAVRVSAGLSELCEVHKETVKVCGQAAVTRIFAKWSIVL